MKYEAKHIRTILKEAFGELLRQIPDPPDTLYVCGNTSLLKDSSVKFLCVVGSRRYSDYGKLLCRRLIAGLKGFPVVIVSGLALGIDAIAHRAALDAGLPTIAVPGSGLHPDVVYPRSHVYLAEEIIQKNGLLLSEFESMTRASPWSFPMRNRIMAGLSHAVLIIEAENDSGTLITARLALDYNRDVGAVPGSVLTDSSKGTNALIRKGAVSITCEDDLRELLGFQRDDEIRENTQRQLPLRCDIYSVCSPEEMSVINLLGQPQTRNYLADHSQLTSSKLQITLSMLEIRGLISETFGHIALRYPPPEVLMKKTQQ